MGRGEGGKDSGRCSELDARVTDLSSDPSYGGSPGCFLCLAVVMVEGGPAAAVGVKRHCRGDSRQLPLQPRTSRLCLLPAHAQRLQQGAPSRGLPTVCAGHASLRVLPSRWSQDAKAHGARLPRL